MKKYIAPACEMMSLAATEMLALSIIINIGKETNTQLSSRLEIIEYDSEWEEEE